MGNFIFLKENWQQMLWHVLTVSCHFIRFTQTQQRNVTSATSCTVSSSIVDISTKHLPATIPRKTPWLPNTIYKYIMLVHILFILIKCACLLEYHQWYKQYLKFFSHKYDYFVYLTVCSELSSCLLVNNIIKMPSYFSIKLIFKIWLKSGDSIFQIYQNLSLKHKRY